MTKVSKEISINRTYVRNANKARKQFYDRLQVPKLLAGLMQRAGVDVKPGLAFKDYKIVNGRIPTTKEILNPPAADLTMLPCLKTESGIDDIS